MSPIMRARRIAATHVKNAIGSVTHIAAPAFRLWHPTSVYRREHECTGLSRSSFSSTPQPPSPPDASALDVLAIHNTLHVSMRCLDDGNSSLFAALFAEDGRCVIKKTGAEVVGRSALEQLCANLHARFRPALHIESNIVLTALPDGTVANSSYWYALLGGEVISTGRHYDVLVPAGNSKKPWLLKHRTIEHVWTKQDDFEDSIPE
eukprot:TRINITY_DN24007_c0_g1_i1.p1 TRINITY_DN24007_c0_g1~~TRINITY_DN24007_c0_g1_i1.p1  ORF type:complete len:206 (+),score=35.88 TRINITY_DN24007_c0_g1_i1:64-681(+)